MALHEPLETTAVPVNFLPLLLFWPFPRRSGWIKPGKYQLRYANMGDSKGNEAEAR